MLLCVYFLDVKLGFLRLREEERQGVSQQGAEESI
jgi:hypothetical protein